MTHYFMLVEDNKDDCEAIVRGFKANGCEYPIEWFQNASHALEHLLNGASVMPLLLFLDLNMPGLDGRSFLHYIQSHKSLRSIPVIVFTTSLAEKDLSYCYAHGVRSYIQKPIQFSKMKEICKNILDSVVRR